MAVVNAKLAKTASSIAEFAGGAMGAERSVFGRLPDGVEIEAVLLRGRGGVAARIMALGAALQSFWAPDRNGRVADITLGYDDVASYVTQPNFWGQAVGRYANRIAGGRFTIDGMTYRLPLNDGLNALHGGPAGFDRKVWRIISVASVPRPEVVLAMTSPAGDQGYPGALDVTVSYVLDEAGALTIDMAAVSDAPTVVSLTNHAVFNLSGEGSADGVDGHRLTIPARRFTPVDASLIPTGELRPVASTVFDFTGGRCLGDGLRDGREAQIVFGRGYDHNFVLDKGVTAEPEPAARLEDPKSGRVLEVMTTEPGLQLYTSNFLDGTCRGKAGHLYRMGDGVALEPQKFPDTPNQPSFGSARVDPEHPYRHRMVYRTSVAA